MDKLLKKITSYLEYLNGDCGLHVSVHFSEDAFSHLPKQAVSKLLKYNSHTNPYCISVKGSQHEKCILSQRELIKACESGESFLRVCHAGVSEYIHPILKNGAAIGFAAVSGFRKAEPPEGVNVSLWRAALCEGDAPKTLVGSVIPPLCFMLEKLAEDFSSFSGDEYNLIIRFLNEYHTSITLDDLCKHFARSKSHISHMFKASSGMTIRAYLNTLKLEDSKKLLKSTDLPVTEIAFESGFNDVSYFISLFKKRFGMSPLKYRKNS